MLYIFFQEEGIESQDEREAVLKAASDKLIGEWLIARSVQAGKEGIERMMNESKTN